MRSLTPGGTVMQYVGDAVMAVFGAPEPYDRPRRPRARRRARHARRAAQPSTRVGRPRAWPPFPLGIGLSTGDVAAALLGSDERVEYTVVGDAVNLCQRLQQFAADGEIVVSDATWEQLTVKPEAEDLGAASRQGPRHAGAAAQDRIQSTSRRCG